MISTLKFSPKIFFLTILVGVVFELFIGLSYSVFTSSAANNSNTFTTGFWVTPTPTPFPTATPSPTPTVTVTPSPTPTLVPQQTVVINELMWSGSNTDTADEWLELRNNTLSDIDISGWKLVGAATGGGTITLPGGSIISGGGFFLVANFSADVSIFNVSPDLVTSSISLNNTNIQVQLRDPSDTLIDIAGDGGLPLAGSNTPPKKSMERNDTPSDGTLSSNWHDSTDQANLDIGATELATPKAANSAP